MQAIANMHWVRPDYLYALLAVLPAMAALLYFSYRQRLAARKEWGEEKLIERFTRPFSRTRELIKGCLWLTATALVVLAAAGPLLTDSPIKVKEGTMRLIAVVDVLRIRRRSHRRADLDRSERRSIRDLKSGLHLCRRAAIKVP